MSKGYVGNRTSGNWWDLTYERKHENVLNNVDKVTLFLVEVNDISIIFL